MEYKLAQACLKGNDFKEGVNALLVDKRLAKWDQDAAHVSSYFDAPEDLELVDSTTFYQYPHHVMSGLPTGEDIKMALKGQAQRGGIYNVATVDDLHAFFLKEWCFFLSNTSGVCTTGTP